MDHNPQVPATRPESPLSVPNAQSARNGEYPVQPYLQREDDGGEHGGLIEYWRILRRYKGTIILIAFLGGLIGFLVTLPQTPIYQARTTVEIVGLNENFLNIRSVNPVTQTGATSETSDIQTQIKILQSESLIERVLAKLKSGNSAPNQQTDTYSQTPTGRTSPTSAPRAAEPVIDRFAAWRKAFNLPAVASVDAGETALKTAAKTLKVRASGQTRILEITVDSTNPKTAADFGNTLATEFIEQNLESRWKATEKTGEWLTRQIDDMRIRLERSEDKLQGYARQAGLIFTQEKTNVSEEKLRQLQQVLTAAQSERIAKQSRFEMANTSPPEALPDILNDPSLRDNQTKLTDLRRQIAELTSTYTPEHPRVKKVQAQFVTIESALQKERAAILTRIKNEYDEAIRKEKLLSVDYGSQAALVSGEGERAIQYNILKREVDSNRSLYDLMLQQLKQATIASALRASNVRVVDPAKTPGRPYKPDATQSAGVGVLAGLFLGVAFVITRDRADRSIQQPGDSTYYLNIPELGIIPSAESDLRKRLRLRGKARMDTDSAQDGTIATAEDRVELITWQRKPSMVAESFRSTLISILFNSDNGSRPRVIVLTSAGPGEGKSTVTSNLAIAIAEVGHKVLLVDADMRKPRAHHIFGLSNDQGLSDLLRNRDGVDLGDVLQPTAVPGLFVLPSGPATSAAASLLYGPQMPQLLAELRKQFDTVLVDTPPMLQISDARVLGRQADRVILVVRSGKTTRDAAQAAFNRFREDGTKVMGTILNDWNPKSSPSGYYGYYSGYYKGYSKYYGEKNRSDS